MEITNDNSYIAKYAEFCKSLEDKYSSLIGEGNSVIVNWDAKIAPKNSLIESEGRCGGGPTRSPKYVEYVERNTWDGITFYYDKHIAKSRMTGSRSALMVAVLMEPKHFRPQFYEYFSQFSKEFDLVLTHDRGTMEKFPNNSIYCIAGAPIIENSAIGTHSDDKTSLVSMCYSNKGVSEFLEFNDGKGNPIPASEGHMFRHKAVSCFPEFSKTPSIDLYGSGSPSGPLSLKSESLINHMFSIVVENGCSDTYFTEKIMDCFLTGNIPIYRGTKNLEMFFDKRGIIEFDTVSELEYILQNKVNEKTYKEMLPYANNNLEFTKQYMYIDDIMLFLILHKIESHGNYSFQNLVDMGFLKIRKKENKDKAKT